MKKKSSTAPSRPKRKTKGLIDKFAHELAEAKARRIASKRLFWVFRISSADDERLQIATAACVEFLQAELGKRCRVALETEEADRKTSRDFMLRLPKVTAGRLRELDGGMAECCKRTRAKHDFLGYGEEVYPQFTWATLGSVLQPVSESSGTLDCREMRFDGLYCHDEGEVSCQYLRFYRDGECVYVNSMGTVSEVAKWLRRERKGITVGTYETSGSVFSAVLEQQEGKGKEPTVFKLKGRFTKQGLKVRAWSSYSQSEHRELYALHQVKLK